MYELGIKKYNNIYNQFNYLGTYAKGMDSVGSHIGIIGVGEQNEVQHVNQTMVCVVFE